MDGRLTLILAAGLFMGCSLPTTYTRLVEIQPKETPVELFTVKVDANEQGKISIAPSSGTYERETNVRIEATPSDGFLFSGWSGTISSAENPLVISVSKNEWIIPVFTKRPLPDDPPEPIRHAVRLDQSDGGTAAKTPEREKYGNGELVCLAASAHSGYAFSRWTGTVETTANPLVLKATRDEWIMPVFAKLPNQIPDPEPSTYAIRIDQTMGGEVAHEPALSAYPENTLVKITAAPQEGYSFAGWTGTLTATANPLVLKAARDEWIIPQFSKNAPLPEEPKPITYTLKVSEAAGGSVLVNPAQAQYAYGEQVLVVAKPDAGYEFSSWNGTAAGTSSELFLTITGNQWLIPHFAPISVETKYSLSASVTGSGSISRIPDKAEYGANETVHIIAKADDGQMFMGWDGAIAGTAREYDIVMNGDKAVIANFKPREWTVVVYMAADNDLERAAILDLCEMESFVRNNASVTILALVDRGPGYDASNGDWTDTRLFEIHQDEGKGDVVIDSPSVACASLGIFRESKTELDMAEPKVLSYLLAHAKTVYRANHYGLIIWGHGTGWRGSEESPATAARAFAIDDSSGSAMGITNLASALDENGLDVIGFDTCFGALLETSYELRSKAEYLVGSEGSIPSTGWDYADLFTRFCASERSARALCAAACSQFSRQYGGSENATISTLKLAAIPELFSAFDSFAGIAARCVTNNATASMVRKIALEECALYKAPSFPCDGFVDVESLRANLTASLPAVVPSEAAALSTASTRLLAALENSVIDSWASDETNARKIGVHLIPFITATTPQASHFAGYIKGSGASAQSSFVKASNGWVPNAQPATSFLDKIFYVRF